MFNSKSPKFIINNDALTSLLYFTRKEKLTSANAKILASSLTIVDIVLKPGPARQVDLGPSRPELGTGPGLSKNQLGIWLGETRSTQINPTEPDLYTHTHTHT